MYHITVIELKLVFHFACHDNLCDAGPRRNGTKLGFHAGGAAALHDAFAIKGENQMRSIRKGLGLTTISSRVFTIHRELLGRRSR